MRPTTTRAGALMETLGGCSNFSRPSSQQTKPLNEVSLVNAMDRQKEQREPVGFPSNQAMIDYFLHNMPEALKQKGKVVARIRRILGKELFEVLYLSTDYLTDPRMNRIEHNAYYRFHFSMDNTPEDYEEGAKLKFDVLAGVDFRNKTRLKNPRLMPQDSFRKAVDKLVDWFKKNEEVLLDWPGAEKSESSVSEGMVDVREVDMTSVAPHTADVLRQMVRNGFKVTFDQQLGVGQLAYKGLLAKFSLGGGSLTFKLPRVYFKDAPKEGVEALRALYDIVSAEGGAIHSEALGEARKGAFYLTSAISRKDFKNLMTEYREALTAAKKAGAAEEVLRSMARADHYISGWISAERTAMISKLALTEVEEYSELLDGFEEELRTIRVMREHGVGDMLDLIADALDIYAI